MAGDDADTERDADQRVDAGADVRRRPAYLRDQGRTPAMISTSVGDDDRDAGKDEVAADGAQRSRAPGQQRTYAGEEEKEDANGHGHAVIEGRAHRDLRALHELGEDREERSPENREAGREGARDC